ncbi:iron ABC transporter permease [Pseudomonas sp. RIT-PI-AD]|uniref:ABC transporter permease n=1 Tax=Pseudomonas sp. RIT-PI-AD TaxID=3035294 RepID=UPI0021D9661D|nr:iron ABC transporter permease [Pseudomonas sp. RIT-PI-AD]
MHSEVVDQALPAPSASPGRRRRKSPPFWLRIPLMALVLVAALPLFYVVARASETGLLVAWQLLWRPFVFGLLANTLKLMVLVTLGCATIGLALAWLVERSDLRGRRQWNVLLCLPFAIPSFVSGFTWISISPMFEGLGGTVLVMILSKYPLIYLPVAATLRNLDPALEESARMLGYNRRQIFWRVTLPLLRPALMATSLLVAVHMLVEFGAPSIMRYQTFTTAIYQQFELEFSNANAAMLSALLLALCMLMLWGEFRLRGRGFARTGQGAARRSAPVRLGAWAVPAQLALVALVAIGCGTPLSMLGFWIVEGSSASFPLMTILETLGSSLSLSFGGALLSCLLALPVCLVVVRYHGRLAWLADRLPYLLHALPGLVIALSLVFFALGYVPALYQTASLLLIAYALLFMPMAQGPIRVALEKASPQLEEAARTLGHTPMSTFLRVTLPIIFPAIGAGFVLVFLDCMKELTATLILGPTGLDTLATAVWSHTANLEYAAAAPYAALLVLVSGLPVYLLTTRAYLRQQGA